MSATKLNKFKNGTKAFIKMNLLNTGYVTQTVAEQRAAVCAACPKNNTDSTSLLIVFMETTTHKGTTQDSQLGVCDVCGCVLKTLVHAEPALVDLEGEYPPACWKNDLRKDV